MICFEPELWKISENVNTVYSIVNVVQFFEKHQIQLKKQQQQQITIGAPLDFTIQMFSSLYFTVLNILRSTFYSSNYVVALF